jgi:hypothetical protein
MAGLQIPLLVLGHLSLQALVHLGVVLPFGTPLALHLVLAIPLSWSLVGGGA